VTEPGLRRIEKVFLFDLYSPWAKVAELGSTHPLTGKRIRALQAYGAEVQAEPLFSFERVDAQGRALDMGRMYGKFFFEALIYFSPWIAGLATLGAGFAYEPAFFAIPLAVGLALLVRALYRYPGLGAAQPTTVIDLMSDPYASPLRGRPVQLEGRVIGKADAGGRFGEDMEMEDRAGGLIMLNYESPLPILGNLWFGSRKATALVGQEVRVLGWFRRSVFHVVDLKWLESAGGKVSSYTRFWGVLGPVLLFVIGLGLSLVGVGAAAQMGWQTGPQTIPTYAPQPGYVQPGYVQPGYVQPGYVQPGYPQPGYPQPAYPQPGNPQPAYPQPAPAPIPMTPIPMSP
jgi:hypothetical protein